MLTAARASTTTHTGPPNHALHDRRAPRRPRDGLNRPQPDSLNRPHARHKRTIGGSRLSGIYGAWLASAERQAIDPAEIALSYPAPPAPGTPTR